jgi:hypothetical protein
MSIETDFKQVTGEDISLVNDEIHSICNVRYPGLLKSMRLAKFYHNILPEPTPEEIKQVIDNNPALTEKRESEYNEKE